MVTSTAITEPSLGKAAIEPGQQRRLLAEERLPHRVPAERPRTAVGEAEPELFSEPLRREADGGPAHKPFGGPVRGGDDPVSVAQERGLADGVEGDRRVCHGGLSRRNGIRVNSDSTARTLRSYPVTVRAAYFSFDMFGGGLVPPAAPTPRLLMRPGG